MGPATSTSSSSSAASSAGRRRSLRSSRSRSRRSSPPRAASPPGRLSRDADQVAQRAEPGERLALELADTLAREVELVADRLERPRLALELRRLAAELDLEPPRRARQLLLTLDHVHRDANRARVVRDRALHRLPDPPRGVRRELVAAPPVELLDRAVQAQRPLLDQVQERHAEASVALGDRHDETKIRLD